MHGALQPRSVTLALTSGSRCSVSKALQPFLSATISRTSAVSEPVTLITSISEGELSMEPNFYNTTQ